MSHEGMARCARAACQAKELRRHDVQRLVDVLAHAHHRLAAFRRRAAGVFRLNEDFYARQMIRQGFALGLARLLVIGCVSVCGDVRGSASQGFELSLQARMVGGEGLFKEAALLSVHALGLGAEPPGLQPSQLEQDAFDLGVAPLDGLSL